MNLFALVADKNIEFALRGLLGRRESLQLADFSYEIRVHTGRDGGARANGVDILALERNADAKLLVLDFEGCGTDLPSATDLEAQLDLKLGIKVGDRSKAIVVEPECDVWLWGSNNKLAEILDWQSQENIRDWLASEGFLFNSFGKPLRPKEAIEAVLRRIRLPRSSSLYREITSQISLQKCQDAAFGRLRATLREWFPVL